MTIRTATHEFAYHGSNGWAATALENNPHKLSITVMVNDRFGDGQSLITSGGTVLATPGHAAIEAEIAEFTAAQDARIAAARKGATSTMRTYATRGNGSVSANEFDNLRGSLGDDLAKQMARQMQG